MSSEKLTDSAIVQKGQIITLSDVLRKFGGAENAKSRRIEMHVNCTKSNALLMVDLFDSYHLTFGNLKGFRII
jgi:hypothetical protein